MGTCKCFFETRYGREAALILWQQVFTRYPDTRTEESLGVLHEWRSDALKQRDQLFLDKVERMIQWATPSVAEQAQRVRDTLAAERAARAVAARR